MLLCLASGQDLEVQMNNHPYENLPSDAFWHQAISARNPLEISGLYQPKFQIRQNHNIATAGSCFAQHFGAALKQRDWQFLDEEPAPPILPEDLCIKNNFGLFSARYGNIYSARQMLQTLQRALGEFSPIDDAWVKNGKLLDPMRPRIEPEGYENKQELEDARDAHLAAVLRVIKNAKHFVFTLGLTEAWINIKDGLVYPICPGTFAGEFDETAHEFHNFTFRETYEDLVSFFELARKINPKIQFLLTVSPVPLTATASGEHVLTASFRSKSVLRAVCAEICDSFDFVDYFPSYEMVSAHPYKAMFFEPDMRSVSQFGVNYVMDRFFNAHGGAVVIPEEPPAKTSQSNPQCDEEILKGFAK